MFSDDILNIVYIFASASKKYSKVNQHMYNSNKME